jgi:F-type H+-transporting ATPase subunit b
MEAGGMTSYGLNRKRFFSYLALINIYFWLTATAAFSASGESGGGITVIPDVSVLIQLANFLFLIWALNVILYKPIRKILRERKENVEGLETSIETYDRDIQEKDEAFALGLKTARAKGLKEKESLVQEANDEEKKIIEDMNSKTQAEISQIREKIAADVETVRASLQQKVDDFANDITQKILGRAV